MRALLALFLAAAAFGQVPRFEAKDVRPLNAPEPHPLLPGTGVWIFGRSLAPGCVVENTMDPRTYKAELCGVRVLFGGIPAKLIFTSPTQINLIAPDHRWGDEMVNVQVIRPEGASAVVPVRFGRDVPVVSQAVPAFTGMPVWVRVEVPWRRARLRYPNRTEPWWPGSGRFEARSEGRALPLLPRVPYAPIGLSGMVGLPHEPRREYLDRAPLHLLFAFDRPGTYEVRYIDAATQSDWTPIEVRASTPQQRAAWFAKLIVEAPSDPVDLLSDYLPSLLAMPNEATLRVLARYLDSPDQVLQRYAQYALNYFDAALLARVLPGVQPLRGGVG